MILPLVLLSFLSLCLCSEYRESLLLRPLPGNALLASFNFRSNTSSQAFDQQNFRLFPRAFGQILQHAHTKELHLRFSLGRWDAENWGARPWQGAREGGTGVELWAWVEAQSDQEATSRWFTLTNALSGLFCASLNFIDSTRTIRPVKIFEPEGTHPESMLPNLQLMHGVLPHEVVCTENLTPFLKLLPCKGKAGISSLLDGHKLFDASFQAMSIDVRPVCHHGGRDCVIEIEQTVDMVLDLDRSKRPRDNPIPRPLPVEEIGCDTSKSYHAEDSCFPLENPSEPAWSLEQVFGRPINGDCQIANESPLQSLSVCINTHPDRTINVLTDPPNAPVQSEKRDYGYLTCFKPPPHGTPFDLHLPEQTLLMQIPFETPPLHAFRSMTGYGQEHGSIQSTLINPSSSPLSVMYLESLPWYMKPYLHTLQATLHPPSTNTTTITQTFYRPALDRHRGTHLELHLVIPPQSTLSLTYDFDKAILRYTEYPPDANRGFDVASAIIRVLPDNIDDAETRRRGIYLRTTSLLLPLPTPDFSMPYNVIILTSTVIALGFGGIFNILVRRFVAFDEVPVTRIAIVLRSVVARVGGRIRGLVGRLGPGSRAKTE